MISYLPNSGFHGTDSVVYKIEYQADPTLYATAKIYFTVIDNSSIEELFVNGKVKIYPNPTDNQLNVSFVTSEDSNLEIKLTNISGRIILSEDYSAIAGTNNCRLNLRGISQGVYFLDIGDASSSLRYKVIVK